MRDAKPKLLVRALRQEGFVENGGSKHLKMVKGDVTLHIQTHGVIKRNTVAAIQKQSGIEKAKFYSHKF
jgi:hypothetical protein